ncbi:TonB family protein [Acidithiobacillus thiooxidans]|uniref:TonB family protein n=1 Tax=Acidithiobacillus thiooxidans TaxID=930 RepID=UPI002860EEA9|nr:TonB family protein [Acidithiobacillus thiooxidans]MDR7926783.1 TonB family protein [Acidithiobacillus thiooxidans]
MSTAAQFNDFPSGGPSGESNSHFKYAALAALLVEVGIIVALMSMPQAPHEPKPVHKVVSVHMVTLPPPPPPMPKVIPPKPVPPKPVVLPRPVVHRPAPAPIQPPAPPQPPVVHAPPPPPTPAPPITPPPPPVPTPVPPAPAPVVYSGIGAYGSGARSLVKQNLQISAIIKRLHLHGTVTVSFKVAPSGGTAYGIHIVSGTDNPLIRRAALRALRATSFPAYTPTMPHKALSFTVPIEIY